MIILKNIGKKSKQKEMFQKKADQDIVLVFIKNVLSFLAEKKNLIRFLDQEKFLMIFINFLIPLTLKPSLKRQLR